MQISILTLFPDLYKPFFQTSIIGKAQQKDLINADVVSLFEFAIPKERIDSPSFGPGAGMLLKPEIIEKAIDSQEKKLGKSYKIFFSPQGKKLNQSLLKSLAKKIKSYDHLLLFASRYEGVDTRVEDYYADETLSIGDFVLMGGDLPVMCFLEAFLRLIPGIIGKEESVEKESFSGPFVDYPEYTAPIVWKDLKVPDVIRSGNHELIRKWRNEQAALKTIKGHFEWLRSSEMSKEQFDLAKSLIPSHYVVLMHSDVLLKDKKVGTTSVTSIDIHDIARSCSTYGVKKYFIVTPLLDQQKIVKTLLDFWQIGYGAEYNKNRAKAIKIVNLAANLVNVIEEITNKEQKEPILISTSARNYEDLGGKYINYYDQSLAWKLDRPILLIFGTGYGLSDDILNKSDFILDPVSGFSDFNHLSVRSATAIVLDRWLGIKIKQH